MTGWATTSTTIKTVAGIVQVSNELLRDYDPRLARILNRSLRRSLFLMGQQLDGSSFRRAALEARQAAPWITA